MVVTVRAGALSEPPPASGYKRRSVLPTVSPPVPSGEEAKAAVHANGWVTYSFGVEATVAGGEADGAVDGNGGAIDGTRIEEKEDEEAGGEKKDKTKKWNETMRGYQSSMHSTVEARERLKTQREMMKKLSKENATAFYERRPIKPLQTDLAAVTRALESEAAAAAAAMAAKLAAEKATKEAAKKAMDAVEARKQRGYLTQKQYECDTLKARVDGQRARLSALRSMN